MTTAHRPTWNPARGGEAQGGFRVIAPSAKYSSRDMPSHLKMKLRQVGQSAPVEVSRKDLKRELQAREAEHYRKKGKVMSEEEFEALEAPPPEAIKYKNLDEDVDLEEELFGSDNEDGVDKPKLSKKKSDDENNDDEDDSNNEDDSDDEDDDAELLRELERIKQEREAERQKKEDEEREFEERQRAEAAMEGNPLWKLTGQETESQQTFRVKRRWDDDVVFRNQARGERKLEPRFINDTIRNDFHRRFLAKYIR